MKRSDTTLFRQHTLIRSEWHDQLAKSREQLCLQFLPREALVGFSLLFSAFHRNTLHVGKIAQIKKPLPASCRDHMETKSLYTILGIRPEASADQIETAYAELLHQLKDGTADNPGGDDRIRLIAAKEAYEVLSDPSARQLYNQKLFAPTTLGRSTFADAEPSQSWNIVKLLVIGAIVIAAIWTYNRNAIEREKLRVEHEKAIVENQIKLEQERMAQQEVNRQAQLQQQQAFQKEAQERAFREQALRESRELDYRLQQQNREQQNQQQREAREKQQAAREQEARQRQQQYEAERQLEREKQALRRLQNENRSTSYKYY